MVKVHLTDTQVKKVLCEINNLGAGIPVAAETDSTGKVTQQSLVNQSNKLKSQGMADSPIQVDQDALTEETIDGINVEQAAREVLFANMSAISNATSAEDIYAAIYDTIGEELGLDPDGMNDADLAPLFTKIMQAMDRILQSGEPIFEGYKVTKRQLKEARLNKMVKESKAIYTKKDLLKK